MGGLTRVPDKGNRPDRCNPALSLTLNGVSREPGSMRGWDTLKGVQVVNP